MIHGNLLLIMKSGASLAAATLTRFRHSSSGAVTIELAATLFALVLLALGAYDFGRLGMRQAQLTSAANAGIQYGMVSQSAASDLPQVIAAARDDAGDTKGQLGISARQYCSCSGSGETACGGTCSDGGYPPLYLEVTVTDDIRMLLDYPNMPRTMTLSSTSVARVR